MIYNFDFLKPKAKKDIRKASFKDIFLNTLSDMFIYNGLPDTIDISMLEVYLLNDGAASIVKINDEWIAARVSFTGDPDVYGRGKNVLVQTLNGYAKTYEDYKNNDNLVVIFNTKSKLPDLNIDRYASLLAEVDTSFVNNVIYSRLLPIPIAKDSKVHVALQKAIEDIRSGKMSVILDENVLSQFTEQPKIEICNISDVANVDRLQYLANFYNFLMGRFYTLYGFDMVVGEKQAQQNNYEMTSYQGISMVLPYNMLAEREKAIEKFNTISGLNVTVSFNKAWIYDFSEATTDEEVEEVIEVEESEVKTDEVAQD